MAEVGPVSPSDTRLAKSLEALGITPGNHRALLLLPLVYVAWADHKMETVEIERIDHIAKHRLYLGPEAIACLDEWLIQAPDREHFLAGLQELFLLAQTEQGEPLVDAEDLHELLLHAEAIARATADALDAPTSVTVEEEAALNDIARIFGIDNGRSWRRLLDELDAGPASIERSSKKPASAL
jgi:hypothetical protein